MTVTSDIGIEEAIVEDDKQDVPSVTADEIVKLTDLAKSIEQHYDEPQDIEWAIEEQGDDKQFFILQSRPETTWNEEDEQQSDGSTSTSDNATERILDHL